MIRQGKYVSGLIAAFLLFVLISSVSAQSFSVSPAEVRIDNLAPGQEREFELTISNKDDAEHIFIFSTYNPEESQRREGRAEFPDNSWISFPHQVEAKANSIAPAKIKVTVPSDTRWTDKDWEVWLGVSPDSGEFLNVKLYVRLLVSTSENISSSVPAGGTDIFSSYQTGRVVRGIGIVIALAIVGVYLLWYRKRRK